MQTMKKEAAFDNMNSIERVLFRFDKTYDTMAQIIWDLKAENKKVIEERDQAIWEKE